MAARTLNKEAVLLLLPPAGTCLDPLVTAWLAACAPRYTRLFTADAADLWTLTPDALVRVRTPDDVLRRPLLRLALPEVNELRQRGAALRALLATPADFFVAGDAHAMRLAARLALWCREGGGAGTLVGLPCCPYNSVPFTHSSCGFPSALAYCVQAVNLMHTARQHDRRRAPIGIVRIIGDAAGWLSVGAAALADAATGVLCLTADTPCDGARLCAQVEKARAQAGAVVIVMGDGVGTAQRRPLAAHEHAGAAVLAELLHARLHVGVEIGTLDPAQAGTPAARGERALATAMARAAVRQAARGPGATLLANHRATLASARMIMHAIPLLESVATPRKVPADFLRPAAYRATAAGARALAPLVSPAPGFHS
ncbi:MAG: 6-phosphofructokinase [bacterium]|nr:6-phosphofructokinase [bacterium]